MAMNRLTSGKNGLTEINMRPNVMIAYSGDKINEAMKLSDILSREEINVIPCEEGGTLGESCIFGRVHMLIVRDGGLSSPSFGLIGRLRSISDMPVLTVSDKCCEIYRTMALAKGADMCMNADEFGSFEFKARVVSLLRRYLSAEQAVNVCADERETLINGGLTIDRRRREVFREGSLVKMTAIEYGIVEYLMENCGNVCTVDDIYRRVWNETPYSVRKTVVEHIRRIRCKLEPDPRNPSYIKVVFGVGYKMERAAG